MGYRAETLARAFANALDADDFAAAEGLLAADCVYRIREQEHKGPEAVLASYMEGSEEARRFEACRYESAIEGARPGAATIRFFDHLEHAGRKHTHSCLQHLAFDDDGHIGSIKHEDLPGERESLASFCDRAGVSL